MSSVEHSSTTEYRTGRSDPRNWPLLVKLMVPIVLVVALGAAISATVALESTRATLKNQIGSSFINHAAGLRGQTEGFLLEKVIQLQTIALTDNVIEIVSERNEAYLGSDEETQAELRRLDAEWINAADNDPLILRTITSSEEINPLAHQLHDFLRAFPYHTELFITDEVGATVAATERLSDYYQADEEWWQAAWNDGNGAVYISAPEFDDSAGVTALLMAVPIYEERSDNVVGIIRTTLNVQTLFALLDSWQLGESGHAVLLDQAGEVLFDPSPETLASELRRSLVADDQGYVQAADEAGTELILGYEALETAPVVTLVGRELRQSTQAIADLDWTLVVQQDVTEALAATTVIGRSIGVVNTVIILIVGLAVFLVVRSVVKPIRQLNEVVNEVAQGRLDVEIPFARRDEVGNLARNFGVMLQRQRDTLEALAQRNRAVETSAQVSQSLSTYLDTQELAHAVVEQIQKAFDYYHAHIYLLDESGKNLVMMAGTGDAGIAMLRNRHNIPVGKGLVGRAAALRTANLVPDVSQEPGWLPNPLLPYTRAEATVPITVGNTLIGVLDVQQNQVNGLDESDIELLESVARQVALAFRNAQTYEDVRAQADQAAIINQINQKIETASTIEGVLDIAARELREAFGAQQTIVELAAEGSN